MDISKKLEELTKKAAELAKKIRDFIVNHVTSKQPEEHIYSISCFSQEAGPLRASTKLENMRTITGFKVPLPCFGKTYIITKNNIFSFIELPKEKEFTPSILYAWFNTDKQSLEPISDGDLLRCWQLLL